MMLRILATLGILSLLALDVWLPDTSLGRRGSEGSARNDAPGAFARIGETLPDFSLRDLDGPTVRISDFAGRRVLLTFERSLDW